MNIADFDEWHEILLRLGVATVLGMVLGIDRDIHHKPAGLRVLALVCLGAAAATMVSVMAVAHQGSSSHDGVLRTVQGILSGIGFLGAGVILHSKADDAVHGLTTAASVWIASIMGIVCGLGQWALATVSFVLTILVLLVGRRIEHLIIRWSMHRRPPDKTISPPDKISGT